MIRTNGQAVSAVYAGDKAVQKVYRGSRLVWEKMGELPDGYRRCKYLEFNRKQRYLVSSTIGAKAGDIVTSISKNKGGYFYNTVWGAYEQAELYYFNETESTRMYYKAQIISQNTVDEISTVVSKMTSDGSNYFVADYGNNAATYLLTGNVYAFKIERDGNEIANLIPCLNASSEPCFFDIVTQTTIKNNRSGVCGYELMDGTYVAPI